MKTLKYLFLSITFSLGLSSCSNFEELNTNPNTTFVGQITPSGMFEPLLYNGIIECLNYKCCLSNELIQFTPFT